MHTSALVSIFLAASASAWTISAKGGDKCGGQGLGQNYQGTDGEGCHELYPPSSSKGWGVDGDGFTFTWFPDGECKKDRITSFDGSGCLDGDNFSKAKGVQVRGNTIRELDWS